ncbi:MAG: PqqD family peptide modification chaperone [Candidatus Omnitrophica bacterium]|nr:PqqD family peptide modification chaperone [Candidatus Omnitrophota bacterium]
MKESIFSPFWYRASKLQPRLRGHVQIHRHHYRGELWYILQDHATGRFFRFNPTTYQVIGLMDGERTVQDLWEKAIETFGDEAPTQGDMVNLLSQLHSIDALVCDIPPDVSELLRRRQKIERNKWKQQLMSPLFFRIPLWDPGKFLDRTIRFVRPCFSKIGGLVWLFVTASAVIAAGQHWSELTKNVVDRILSAQNLAAITLLFPFLKAFHEMGHAYAVKRWGGEVHEMGIMLLVLMPIPYVDASGASAFRDRRHRLLVGAAGMMVELFIASLALHLWLNIEAGYVRSALFNVIVLASISTILFNANPLLRYDGYYILSDWLEISNLAQRSLEYLGYLFKRYLFGVKDVYKPHTGPGERFWLITYSISSFLYRIFIYAAIVLFIAGKFFIIGVLIALWSMINMFVVPIYKRIYYIMFDFSLREKRKRAFGVAGALAISFGLLLFVAPFPFSTLTEGIIWAPEESLVRAGTSGFVEAIEINHHSMVKKSDRLIQCSDPLLSVNIEIIQAQIRELEARRDAEIQEDRVQADVIQDKLDSLKAELKRAQERVSELSILSPRDGLLILPRAEDLAGRYIQQGDLLAYILNIEKPLVRVVIPQSKVDLVRSRTTSIEVRLAENIDLDLSAAMIREVPGAMERLPSTILGRAGGGDIAIDPWDAEGLKTFEKIFQFDIEITQSLPNIQIGGRVYVLFRHGYKPIGFQAYRSIRQLFLRRFNV